MQKTYKCKNGHRFKKEESNSVTCPTCNEQAELVQWNTVGEFDSNKEGIGLMHEFKSAVNDLKGKKK
jgi:hypothetical protein